jgi:hypothetical protein
MVLYHCLVEQMWWSILYVILAEQQSAEIFDQTLFWVCLWVLHNIGVGNGRQT